MQMLLLLSNEDVGLKIWKQIIYKHKLQLKPVDLLRRGGWGMFFLVNDKKLHIKKSVNILSPFVHPNVVQ